MSAAQLEMSEQEETFAEPSTLLLKQQVAERLASHRSRRTRMIGEPGDGAKGHGVDRDADTGATSRSSVIAAAVAERYAQTQSYRVFLAEEAEKAMAAAAVAARSARAIAETQRALLDELQQMAPADVRLDVPAVRARAQESIRAPRPTEITADDVAEDRALDEEIAFRLSPVTEVEPAQPIPGNLLEFPRQLVATRKARPRYAEGPLREGADLEPEGAQLRIFEVDAAQISSTPIVESASPEWSSIWLDTLTHVPEEAAPEPQFAVLHKPEAAPMAQRAMAAIVDGCLIAASFLVFATVFARQAAILPSPLLGAMAAAGILPTLFVLYRTLFFTFSDATPGMRYARVGLCTFADDNPTRSAMRRRTFSILLAACPLGLGLLWAWLDEDRLGWHDRLSKMYPRSY